MTLTHELAPSILIDQQFETVPYVRALEPKALERVCRLSACARDNTDQIIW